MSADDWGAVLDTNLSGAFYTARPALRGMLRRRSGSIVAVSSVVGLIGNAGQANYAAAKAGLIGLTRALAREAGGRGVRVNAVAPGYIATDMTDVLSDEQRAAILGEHAAGAARRAGRRRGRRRVPLLPRGRLRHRRRALGGRRAGDGVSALRDGERPPAGGGDRPRPGHLARHRARGELGRGDRGPQRRRADRALRAGGHRHRRSPARSRASTPPTSSSAGPRGAWTSSPSSRSRPAGWRVEDAALSVSAGDGRRGSAPRSGAGSAGSTASSPRRWSWRTGGPDRASPLFIPLGHREHGARPTCRWSSA